MSGTRFRCLAVVVLSLFPSLVFAQNVAPIEVGTGIPTISLTTESPASTLNLDNFFSDANGDILTYTICEEEEGPSCIGPSYSNIDFLLDVTSRNTLFTRLNTTARVFGVQSFYIRAGDPGGLFAYSSFYVIYNNTPPSVVRPISDFVLRSGDVVTFDLNQVFADPDPGSLDFSLNDYDDSILEVDLDNDASILTIQLEFNNDWGPSEVCVTADDNEFPPFAPNSKGSTKGSDPGILSEVEHCFNVNAVNTPPFANPGVPDLVLPLGESFSTDLDVYYTEIDPFDYLYMEDVFFDDSVIDFVFLDEGQQSFRITSVGYGQTVVTFRFEDTYSAEVVEHSFTVVVPNDPPELLTQSLRYVLDVGDSVTIPVTDLFLDPEDDPLLYGALPVNRNVADASESGGVITITGLVPGSTLVQLFAQDPYNNPVGIAANVRVNSPLMAMPPSSPIQVPLGESIGVNLNQFISDTDDSQFDFELVGFDSRVVAADIFGAVLTLGGTASGLTTVDVMAYDISPPSSAGTKGNGEKAGVLLSLPIEVIGGAPVVVSPIPPQEIEPGEIRTINLAGVFVDPEGDEMFYDAYSLDPMIADVLVEDDVLTLQGIMSGTVDIEVYAYDSSENTGTTIFTVRVNRPPVVVGSVGDIALLRDETVEISIVGLFSDPDEDELQIDVENSNVSAAIVSLNLDVLTITGLALGETTISLTADDALIEGKNSGEKATVTYDIPVRVVNAPPVAVMQPEDVFLEIGDSFSFFWSPYFADPEGLPMTATGVSSNPAIVQSTDSGLSIDLLALTPGTVQIEVTVTDDGGDSVSQTFSVFVNAPPVVIGMAGPFAILRGASGEVDLTTIFSDPDDDELSFSADIPDDGIVTGELSGSVLSFTGLALGTTTIQLHASDEVIEIPNGSEDRKRSVNKASANASVVINVINARPIRTGSQETLILEAGESTTLDPTDYFFDADGEILTFEVASTNLESVSAVISQSGLVLNGLAPGNAQIMLTASDPQLDTAQLIFSVIVNSPPLLTTAFENQTLLRSQEVVIALADNFTDPNEDPLFFTVFLDDPSLATVRVEGSDLTLTGLSIGSTLVTIEASDREEIPGKGSTDKAVTVASFVLEVVNTPPVAIALIPDQSLAVDQSVLLDLLLHFEDPDGTELSFEAFSENPGAVSVLIENEFLTLTGVGPGTSQIEVFASDPDEGSVSSFFSVRVNNAPAVLSPLPDVTLFTPGPDGSFVYELLGETPVFIDPDGDPLQFSATINPAGIATAVLNGSAVTVSAVAPGTAIVSVTASDSFGASVTDTAQIQVIRDNAPTISSITLPNAGDLGTDVPVQVAATDDRALASGTLQYRSGDEQGFTSIPLSVLGGTPASPTLGATIPGADVTTAGLEVRAIVTDDVNEPVFSATRGMQVRIPAGVLSIPATSFNVGITENDYRLVSSPVSLVNPDAESILAPALGAYDASAWRFLRQGPPGGEGPLYVDLEDGPMPLRHGDSFWMLTRGVPNPAPQLGAGITTPTVDPFVLNIPPGWTMIGAPFNFGIPTGRVRLNFESFADVQEYNGTFSPASEIRPFGGYFVANNSNSPAPLAFFAHSIGDTKEDADAKVDPFAWKVGIEATVKGSPAADRTNFIGVAEGASDELDEFDLPEPPTFGSFVSVAFEHALWPVPIRKFRSDVRAANSEGSVWEMTVSGNVTDPVDLRFTGTNTLPEGTNLILVDPISGVRYNLRERDSISLNSIDGSRQLTLIAGNKEFVEKAAPEVIPTVSTLAALYPNPVHGAVTVQFDIAAESTAEIRVYNILGQEVGTILQAQKLNAGKHAIVWNAGETLPNGLYVARMVADGVIQARTFTVMR